MCVGENRNLQLAVSIKYVALENRVYEIFSKFLQMATNEPSADKAYIDVERKLGTSVRSHSDRILASKILFYKEKGR